jgi:hypothetical protein
MKKATEVGNQQQVIRDLVEQVDEIKRRLERIDPSPTLKTLEPYPVGSIVYSIIDLEAHNPMTVISYRAGRITVMSSPGEAPRDFPIASVIPLAKCKNAQLGTDQVYADVADPKLRTYLQGRHEAQVEAKTKPFTPPLPEQHRYGW